VTGIDTLPYSRALLLIAIIVTVACPLKGNLVESDLATLSTRGDRRAVGRKTRRQEIRLALFVDEQMAVAAQLVHCQLARAVVATVLQKS